MLHQRRLDTIENATSLPSKTASETKWLHITAPSSFEEDQSCISQHSPPLPSVRSHSPFPPPRCSRNEHANPTKHQTTSRIRSSSGSPTPAPARSVHSSQ
ncbi:hypothetical protein EJ05DRAFT_339237 [Pseudovirgaria hyperparasitica]|uniref:Uncharacterized protein n=1 Tax=Pseudovirgaria hyperparasitica TaxID=470096 RepID=A0A6A6W9L8_9PEZI|nr:uncharacterized protein EJ05DRAFT_339237 [Pseudovirgaria hyperparasitica]KAF2759255.1 hypothetical protein EJ05DRAFT_339237 [Pseudovirgaria hyperparasitica]